MSFLMAIGAISEEDPLRLELRLIEVLPKLEKLFDDSLQKGVSPLFHLDHQFVHLLDERSRPSIGRDYFLYLFELKSLHFSVLHDQQRKQTHQKFVLNQGKSTFSSSLTTKSIDNLIGHDLRLAWIPLTLILENSSALIKKYLRRSMKISSVFALSNLQ